MITIINPLNCFDGYRVQNYIVVVINYILEC